MSLRLPKYKNFNLWRRKVSVIWQINALMPQTHFKCMCEFNSWMILSVFPLEEFLPNHDGNSVIWGNRPRIYSPGITLEYMAWGEGEMNSYSSLIITFEKINYGLITKFVILKSNLLNSSQKINMISRC